jgi:hypothetical protein
MSEVEEVKTPEEPKTEEGDAAVVAKEEPKEEESTAHFEPVVSGAARTFVQ